MSKKNISKASHLNTISVMLAGNTLHEMRRGMVAEIGRHISDPQAARRRELLGKRVVLAMEKNLNERKNDKNPSVSRRGSLGYQIPIQRLLL